MAAEVLPSNRAALSSQWVAAMGQRPHHHPRVVAAAKVNMQGAVALFPTIFAPPLLGSCCLWGAASTRPQV